MRAAAYVETPDFFRDGKTHSPYKVWKDSTTADLKAEPVSYRERGRIVRYVRRRLARERSPGRKLQQSVATVIYSLLYDFMDDKTGELYPSHDSIARKTGLGRSTVAAALDTLQAWGVLSWINRAVEEVNEAGGWLLRQTSNWYRLILPREPKEPPPDPDTWGKQGPLMLKDLDQGGTAAERNKAAQTYLDRSPDALEQALARLGRYPRDS